MVLEESSSGKVRIMGRIMDIEWRELPISPKERAAARDSYVRNFDRQFGDWTDIATVCIAVERDEDWKLLGFESWHDWLLQAAPRSRSYIYIVVGRYKELIQDIPAEELAEIPLGTAGQLRKMSKSSRRSPAVREAAKKKPAAFLEEIEKIAPEQHLEKIVEMKLVFSASQWNFIRGVFEKWCEKEGPGRLEQFIEWMATEVSDWNLHVDQEKEGRADDPEGRRLQ